MDKQRNNEKDNESSHGDDENALWFETTGMTDVLRWWPMVYGNGSESRLLKGVRWRGRGVIFYNLDDDFNGCYTVVLSGKKRNGFLSD